VLAVVFRSGISLWGQSALDAPGEKKITVGSEISRGYSAISSAATAWLRGMKLSFVQLDGYMATAILRNKSRQADSDGFMLGASFAKWKEVDWALELKLMDSFNSPSETARARRSAAQYLSEVRKLQKTLGIDDQALLRAIDCSTPQCIERIKGRIAQYESVSTSESTK
jgi:hypothetical protein